MGDFFSRREGFTLPQGEQVDDLNRRTRNGLAHILEALHEGYHYDTSWREITDDFFNAIGELPTNIQGYGGFHYLVKEFVVKAKWHMVFDLLEIVYYRVHMRARELAGPLQQAMNNLFGEEIVRWRMVEGQFERIIDQVDVIRRAESTLKDEEFAKAHEHFSKAWQAFHKRPDPDLIGCMRDAWDSVEIIATYCAGLDDGTFGDALPNLIEKGIVLKDWKPTFARFYGLANPWVRHPKAEPLPCKIEDAEMFLVFASQMIIYMITRYKQVKK